MGTSTFWRMAGVAPPEESVPQPVSSLSGECLSLSSHGDGGDVFVEVKRRGQLEEGDVVQLGPVTVRLVDDDLDYITCLFGAFIAVLVVFASNNPEVGGVVVVVAVDTVGGA